MLNRLIANILPYIPKSIIWLVSKNYIAGTTVDDAIKVSRQLNRENILVTLDVLGEFITSIEQAVENRDMYLNIIEVCQAKKIRGNFSVKPTSFGLLIDENRCFALISDIVKLASDYDNFVTLDMEDSKCVDKELLLFAKLHKIYPSNVGIVFQSYLKRTISDLEQLISSGLNLSQINIRLCKGIYNEPSTIAYKDYDTINSNYLKLLRLMLNNGIYSAIATHDKYLIMESLKMIDELNISKKQYEFQMLFGVTPNLRTELVKAKHKMRVYIPFGKEWFGYATRRLKENPQMVKHIIKALFIKQ